VRKNLASISVQAVVVEDLRHRRPHLPGPQPQRPAVLLQHHLRLFHLSTNPTRLRLLLFWLRQGPDARRDMAVDMPNLLAPADAAVRVADQVSALVILPAVPVAAEELPEVQDLHSVRSALGQLQIQIVRIGMVFGRNRLP